VINTSRLIFSGIVERTLSGGLIKVLTATGDITLQIMQVH